MVQESNGAQQTRTLTLTQPEWAALLNLSAFYWYSRASGDDSDPKAQYPLSIIDDDPVINSGYESVANKLERNISFSE